MSIDIEPRPASRAADPTAPAGAELPRLPGRRNPRWIALGLVLLCLGGLLSSVVYASLARETTVVTTTATVFRGEVVEASDLTTVAVRAGTVPDLVPGTELETLVGRRAAFDLPAGSLVTRAAVANALLPATGRSAVGIRLVDGRAPTGLLQPSSPVRLVALPPPDGGTADELSGKTFDATVIAASPGADGASTLLEVQLDTASAATVAMLSAAERLAVVREADR